MSKIHLGTSGFSFKDWIGTIYPQGLKLSDALHYYANELGFDSVEINATYYALISESSFSGMEKKTPADFRFVVKAFRGITHDPFDPRLKDNERPTRENAQEDSKKFIYSLGPLRAAKKLGAVLFQFPVFFLPSESSFDFLTDLSQLFTGVPMVIEFRSRAWNTPATFEFLRKDHIAYCMVDEPPLPRLMPFINEVTSEIAYLRFHGRNPHWFNMPLADRHNYLYSMKELEGYIAIVNQAAAKAKETYVFFNNCHLGFAAKNAFTLQSLLKNSTIQKKGVENK